MSLQRSDGVLDGQRKGVGSTEDVSSRVHALQCMEVLNGNRSIEQEVRSAGLEAWVFSQPYQGSQQGGDLHYLSLCVGGIVTRVVLADVAGHGEHVASTSKVLLKLMRRFMNTKKQDRLVAEINRHFTQMEPKEGFATAVVATYWSHKSKLLLTNAGHPRPLMFRNAIGRWEYLDTPTTDTGLGENFPFGLDGATRYEHFVLKVEPGDWLILYSDAYTESRDAEDRLLGESGLLGQVEQISRAATASQFGRELNRRVSGITQGWLGEDDTTLIAIRFTGERRRPGVTEKSRAYWRVIRDAIVGG